MFFRITPPIQRNIHQQTHSSLGGLVFIVYLHLRIQLKPERITMFSDKKVIIKLEIRK
jgi:hypothetical protein